ncbi:MULTISPECIES: hypothetical protein [unclassified Streptomyces]|uniref:hypothetical protein n=1 Tax=unclassified Streptomyces TaxID=2593676 RepID=UPI0035E281FA
MTTFDMGTVPTWISGLGTTGALWVGAVTLRRAQNQERRAEANAVTCDEKRGACCGYAATHGWLASVSNGSQRPIQHIHLITFDSETGTMGASRRMWNTLQPGITDHIHVEGGSPEWSSPAAVIFRDADGVWWLRDILEQSLYRRNRLPYGPVRRTMRSLKKSGRFAVPGEVKRGGNGHHAPW